ncbi:hypothetical protein CF126_03955 [Aeromonas dhakensis]|uniref:ash family protein n=1 Tax=Aeromonas dhakensis TaxID=196024 RepID=UPI00111A8934|nr:ash family protein [Aeromonas dhakensis]TNI58713.1 hypothetical protein CF126_03955 [Aeromonas dhakensis]
MHTRAPHHVTNPTPPGNPARVAGGLHVAKFADRIHPVAAKSATGRRNLLNSMATLTPKASFFVSVPSVAIPSGQYGPVSMAALAGQSSDWSVSIEADIPTPVSVATICKRRNLGGNSINSMEAAHMATTPTHSHPNFASRSALNAGSMIFTFAIAPRLARLAALSRCRIVHVTARTESQARASLAALSAAGEPIGLSLVFVSRLPEGGLSA